MTKTKFFEALEEMAKFHNAKARDFKVYTHVESAERQAEMLAIAGRRQWFFNAIGVCVRDCWYICIKEHNSVETMERNLPKFTRWLKEWKSEKSAEEAHVEEAHAKALAFNAEVDEVAAADQWDKWANQHDSRKTVAQMIDIDHEEALDMNEWHGFTEEQRAVQNERVVYGINLMHKMAAESAVEACHAEALVLNEMVDDAVVFGTTTNENAWPNARNDAVAKIRDDLINYYGTVEPRFIIKMMISVRNLARKATDAKIAWWNEVMSRPSSPEAGSEIPF